MTAPTTDDPAGGAKPLAEALKDAEQSSLGNVSIRGWIAISLTATTCGMSIAGMTVEEPLYSLVLLAIGFYFGQKK